MASKEWKPSPDVVRVCKQLGAELETACKERRWNSLTIVARRTGLGRKVIHSIFNGHFVRQGFLLTLVDKLDKRLWLGPKEPSGAEPASTADVLAGTDISTVAALAFHMISVILRTQDEQREDTIVDRRALMEAVTVLLTDAMVPESVRRLFLQPRCPALTPDDIDALSVDCGEYLRRQDATAGGGAICDLAVTMHEQVTSWLYRDAHPPPVARALEAFRWDLGAWIGWLTLDAGHRRLTRHYLDKTITGAQMSGCLEAEAHAWENLSVLLDRIGRPQDSLQAARHGLRVAERHGNPRARALFHLRAAKAVACLGDSRGFAGEIRLARRLLEQELHGEIAPWIRFLTTGGYIIGSGHLALRQFDDAVFEFRSIADGASGHYHSNAIRATVQVAHTLALQGDYSLSGTTGLGVLPEAAVLSSEWIRGELLQLRNHFARQSALPQPARDFIAAYDETVMLRGSPRAT